ncbi:hypothetical protein BG418_01405 [Streptomyces sp. CBMA152]|nr:hypothetical protein [Streptomyces sp. CBMA152]MBD0743000.1 hypothetical protein [Streptomyces sp. CBMA152]
MADAADADELIGRCYTKARRTPLVVGSVPGGGGRSLRLPGGPYTLTQLAAIVAAFTVLILTRAVWGGHGPVDVGVLLGCPFGAAYLLRHLHIDGRNPAAAAASVVAMLAGPRWGRLHGRPFRPASPTRSLSRITVGTQEAAADEVPAAAVPGPEPTASRRVPRTTAPATPAPALVPAAATPVASGVQALLARRAASHRTGLED